MAAPVNTVPVESISGKTASKSFADLLRDGDMCRTLGTKLKLEEAVKAYEAATRLEPQNAKAFEGLGQALMTLGEYEKAEEALRTAYSLDRKRGNAYELAKVLLLNGKEDEACDFFTKAGANPDVAAAQAKTELMIKGIWPSAGGKG